MSVSTIFALVTIAVLLAWTYGLVELESNKSRALADISKQEEVVFTLEKSTCSLDGVLKCISLACNLPYSMQMKAALTVLEIHQKDHQAAVASIKQHWYLLLEVIVFSVTSLLLALFTKFLFQKWKLKQAPKWQETIEDKVDTTKGKPNVAPDPQVVVIFKRTWDKHFETSGVLGVCQALGIDTEKYAELIPTIKTKEEFTKKFLGVA